MTAAFQWGGQTETAKFLVHWVRLIQTKKWAGRAQILFLRKETKSPPPFFFFKKKDSISHFKKKIRVKKSGFNHFTCFTFCSAGVRAHQRSSAEGPAHQGERLREIRNSSARENGSTGLCVPRSQRTRFQNKDKAAPSFGPLRGAAGTVCGNKNKSRDQPPPGPVT